MFMFARLPESLDPWRSAERGLVLKGAVPLRELHRLRDLLATDSGEAAYEIRFEQDEHRRALIHGSIRAELVVECQRCLGPLTVPVAAELSLVAVQGVGEARELEEMLEPLLVEQGLCQPLDLIEEELLLALPLIPLHAQGTCQPPPYRQEGETAKGVAQIPADEKRTNPFSALAEYKIPTKH